MNRLVLLLPLLGGVLIGFWLRDTTETAAQDAGPAEQEHPQWNPELRGDVNADGRLDIADGIFILNYCLRGGPQPGPLPSGGASGVRLPRTGQETCWAGTRGEPQDPCPSPGQPDSGQDAYFLSGAAREFELVQPDPEDFTTWYTIDFATGLMWQYEQSNRVTWRDALAAAEGLELGGFDDWRIPNAMELFSIVNWERWDPHSYTDYFRIRSAPYWTSTTCIYDASRAVSVRFNNGNVTCPDKGGQGQGANNFYWIACRTLE